MRARQWFGPTTTLLTTMLGLSACGAIGGVSGKRAREIGHLPQSGEGGMIPDERRYSTKWFYQCIQSRYGFNPNHLRLADAVEFFIGQGCKVGLGGHLMGQKVTDQVLENVGAVQAATVSTVGFLARAGEKVGAQAPLPQVKGWSERLMRIDSMAFDHDAMAGMMEATMEMWAMAPPDFGPAEE